MFASLLGKKEDKAAKPYQPPVYAKPVMDSLIGLDACQQIQAEIVALQAALEALDVDQKETLEKLDVAKRTVHNLELEVVLGQGDSATIRQRQIAAGATLVGLREYHADFIAKRDGLLAEIASRQEELPKQRVRDRVAAIQAARQRIEPELKMLGDRFFDAAVAYAAAYSIVTDTQPGMIDPDRLLSKLCIERGVKEKIWNEIVRLTGVLPL